MSQPYSRSGRDGDSPDDEQRLSAHPSPDTTSFPPEAASPVDFDPAANGCPPPSDLADHPRYCVLGWLGSGGMGAVYKARHRLMDRLVALKVVHAALLDRPSMVERFRRE